MDQPLPECPGKSLSWRIHDHKAIPGFMGEDLDPLIAAQGSIPETFSPDIFSSQRQSKAVLFHQVYPGKQVLKKDRKGPHPAVQIRHREGGSSFLGITP